MKAAWKLRGIARTVGNAGFRMEPDGGRGAPVGPASDEAPFSKSRHGLFFQVFSSSAVSCGPANPSRVAPSASRGDLASNRRPLTAAHSSTPTSDQQTMFPSKLLPKCLLS